MASADPWEDEGFGGEDDWEARESLETDLEDDEDTEADELDNEGDADGELDPGA